MPPIDERRPIRVLGYVMTAVGALMTLAISGTTIQIIGSEFANRAIRWSTVETTALLALPLIAIGMGLIVGGVSLARNN